MHLTAPLGDQNQLQSRPCKCTSPSNPGLPSTPLSETALTTSNTTHRNNKLRPLSTNTQHHKIHVSNRPPSLNHALQSGRKATEQQAFSPETFETNTTRRKRRRSRGNSFPPPLPPSPAYRRIQIPWHECTTCNSARIPIPRSSFNPDEQCKTKVTTKVGSKQASDGARGARGNRESIANWETGVRGPSLVCVEPSDAELGEGGGGGGVGRAGRGEGDLWRQPRSPVLVSARPGTRPPLSPSVAIG